MDLRERIASLMSRVRPELAELVAIRSVADPRQFPPEECARAAQWVLDAFAGAGDSGDGPDRGAVPATLRGHPELILKNALA
jgi:acetylornithine deacetylase/succinyl-diaminopimelate desuccinylase-like protein